MTANIEHYQFAEDRTAVRRKFLQKCSFQLPSMSRTYFDLKTAYIRGKIKMVNATDSSVDYLDTNIYSIIDRLEVSVANVVIDNIPKPNENSPDCSLRPVDLP